MMPGTLVISDTLNQLPSYLRRRSRLVVGEEGGSSPGPEPAFSPLDNAKLSEWWNVLSLMQDGPGPVDSWSGLKGVFTLNASTTERPTLVTNDGDGKPALQFDGVDDVMSAGIVNADLFGLTGTAYEVWLVLRATSGAARGIFAASGISNQLSAQAAGSVTWNAPRGEAGVTAALDIRDNAWHVLRLNKNGSNRIIAVDGVEIYNATTTAGTYGAGGDVLEIGNYFGVRLLGGVRHALFFTDVLTDPEAMQMTTYLEGWT